MTSEVMQLRSRAVVQIRLWLILRIFVPIIVAATVLYLTRDQDYFGVFIPLAWALFAVHLIFAFAFEHTHVLDIGAYLPLFYLSSTVAQISESGRFEEYGSWITMIVLFLLYAFLSLVGRVCAGKRLPDEPS